MLQLTFLTAIVTITVPSLIQSFIPSIITEYKLGFTDKINISEFLATSLLSVVTFYSIIFSSMFKLVSFKSDTIMLFSGTIFALVIPPIIACAILPHPINPITLFITIPP